ncbi:MAG: hypothetical protein VX768_13980 [Planctomycetota bacterium]|nr:hypothetical protein [Planctomycetota bacterium]
MPVYAGGNSLKRCRCLLWLCLLNIAGVALDAQDAIEKPAPLDELVRRQEVLTARVTELENRLLKLSQLESGRNDERADLLRQSLELSQNLEVVSRLRKTVDLLRLGNSIQLREAIQKQEKALKNLSAIYDVLERQDPRKTGKSRLEKIRERVNRLEQLIRQQESLQLQLGKSDSGALADEQDALERTTGDLQQKVDSEMQKEGAEKTSPLQEGAGETEKTEKADPRGNPETPSTYQGISPALERAQQQMKRAAKKIRSSKLDDSAAEMEGARAALGQAKSRLEKKLRQEREEEIESTLRGLEERFNRILQMQLRLNGTTRKLMESQKPGDEKKIDAFAQAGEQRKILLEVDRAMLVLNEEGSSRAIAGTLEQVRSDMSEVTNRLELFKLDRETVFVQKEIVGLLGELVQSVQREQAEQKNLKRGSPAGQGETAESGKRPLVQKISELKIIRQLQVRINNRHAKYAEEMMQEVEPDRKREIIRRTRQLSGRQKQLQEMTYELIGEGSQ